MRLHPDPEFDRLLLRAFAADAVDRTAIEGAAHIAPRDVVGWERYWRLEGDRALGRADARLASDDVAGAGRSLLCAASAYGLAAILYRADPGSVAWQTNRSAQVSAFRAAMPLAPIGCEVVEISGGTVEVHGYLFHGSIRNGPCVLVASVAEDGYAGCALAAVDAGLSCLVVELTSASDGNTLESVVGWARRTGLTRLSLLCSDTSSLLSATRHRVSLDAIVCCLDDDLGAVSLADLLPGLLCPLVLLPGGSPIDTALAWIPRDR
jgi:hypothetical protein